MRLVFCQTSGFGPVHAYILYYEPRKPSASVRLPGRKGYHIINWHYSSRLSTLHHYPCLRASVCLFFAKRTNHVRWYAGYRQCLRHVFACHCRRGFHQVQYLLLTSREFSLRHISVMLSDIGHVGGGKDDSLKLSRCGPKNGLQLFPLNIHLHIREFAPAYS